MRNLLLVGVLYLSATSFDKGYIMSGNVIQARTGYTLVINGVQTKSAVLTNDTDYAIMVVAL